MKRLILLRHAKSSWDDPVERDFDRPLNAKGKRAAETMGRHMREEGVTFDAAIASPAIRVVETLQYVGKGYGKPIDPLWDRRAYLASNVTLLDIVHEASDDGDALLLSGHNSGLEDLVLLLVPDTKGDTLREAVEEKFPTCSLAEMEFDADSWADIRPAAGTLLRFVRPRDLAEDLGPDLP
ncbi:SixA phosphatase family protein [Parasphingopyxis marina]|uniref:Histidine phosphatase family protein n=1 Tax=Parasphingopyxis marina TaxID=2761622 RepID=A0A842I0M5_9SPHN|nr:histidine phosphatase family protein [Parasphingopyxis marina]MBC2779056.1 histidine phosphatase family protein [Parasphingopyxis marina]